MSKSNLEFRKIASLKFLYEVNCDGTIFRNARSKRVLKCRKQSHNSRTEYWCVCVNIGKKIRKVYIHKVVAECWLGAKPEGYEIDHIDRNSLNNHWMNLRYVTKSEQMKNRNYDKFMDKLLANLAAGNKGHINPVQLIRDGEKLSFPTARRAAKYLAQVYPHKKEKSFNDKFYLRRKHIFDYDVIYRNAETGHGDQEMGKEQSTKYLVGTTDRWNDSKQAEERERVKHDVLKEFGDIYEVVSRYVKLKRENDEWRGKCPFCGGKDDSLRVNNAKGFFFCCSCEQCGNAPKFLSLMENINYREACERLGIKV